MNERIYVHFEVQCIKSISLLHDIVSSVAPIRTGAASPPPRQLGGQGTLQVLQKAEIEFGAWP